MGSRHVFFALLLPATLAAIEGRTSAQANVVENQTTYVYVDASLGSDSNSGAAAAPFKTMHAAINKANTYNQNGTGVKVIVNPGVYREGVTIGDYKVTSAPLTVQAAVTGTAVISGSDVPTGWAQESATTYQRSFPHTTTFCAIPSGWPHIQPIVQRTEMVFVNGVPLTQVMSHDDLKPGTFFVSDAYQMMHIAPPAGTNMATALIEAAVRPMTLNVAKRSNVVIRGLVFKHAANCINSSSAAINSGDNVLVDSVQAIWNNWGGLGVFSSINTTVQNSVASYNGGAGFMGTQDQKALYNFNESDYNNWRGAQGAFYDWAMGGTKLFQMHGATVQNHFSYNNQAQGLWFDTDNKNIVVDHATLVGNVQAGLQIERNEGPITLQNSTLCSSGQGVNVLTSPNLTIKGNSFYNNSGTNKYQAQIYLAGQAGGKIITDWQTGQQYHLFTTGMVLSGNTFQNAAPGQLAFGTYLSGNDWTQFASTLNASNNTWYDSTTPNAFKIVNGKLVNLATWQSTVQTDYSSVWQAPATPLASSCAVPKPALADFNVNVDSNAYTMSGKKAVATVHVNSFGYGTVNLQVSGLPAGVSAAFSHASLVSGASTLTITASSTAKTQTVPVTVWAISGSRVHNVTVYVSVSAI